MSANIVASSLGHAGSFQQIEENQQHRHNRRQQHHHHEHHRHQQQLNMADQLSGSSLSMAMSASTLERGGGVGGGGGGGAGGKKKLGKLVGKKAARLKELVLQNLGKSERTSDELFKVHEQNFYKQQTQVGRLAKEIKVYLAALKQFQEASRGLNRCIQNSTGDYQPARHDLVCESLSQLEALNEDRLEKLHEQVLKQVGEYLGTFEELRQKIAKRNRKLIDYDKSRRLYELSLAQLDKRRAKNQLQQQPQHQIEQQQSSAPQQQREGHNSILRGLKFLSQQQQQQHQQQQQQQQSSQTSLAGQQELIASRLVEEARLLKLREHYSDCKLMYETINGELHQQLPSMYEKKMKSILTALQSHFALEARYHSSASKLMGSVSEVIDEMPRSVFNGRRFVGVGDDQGHVSVSGRGEQGLVLSNGRATNGLNNEQVARNDDVVDDDDEDDDDDDDAEHEHDGVDDDEHDEDSYESSSDLVTRQAEVARNQLVENADSKAHAESDGDGGGGGAGSSGLGSSRGDSSCSVGSSSSASASPECLRHVGDSLVPSGGGGPASGQVPAVLADSAAYGDSASGKEFEMSVGVAGGEILPTGVVSHIISVTDKAQPGAADGEALAAAVVVVEHSSELDREQVDETAKLCGGLGEQAQSEQAASSMVEICRAAVGDDIGPMQSSSGSAARLYGNGPALVAADESNVLYRVRTNYKYLAEDVDELCFEVDEIIKVIEFDDNHQPEEGWLMGIREINGQQGLFPANFTTPI